MPATISFGPKLGLLNNAAINQTYYDQLRKLIQALDQLIMGNVINATAVVPPSSPNNGDSYLISSTPSGAWSTFPVNSIAVWDTQVTNSGTNTLNPAWVNYVPKSGWIIWNIALGSLVVFNGSAWTPFAGGANFPTNTDITSMTGIPNTGISSTGYTYNDGTNPPTYVGNAALPGDSGQNGFRWGTGSWSSPTSVGTVIIGNGPWTGLDATGVGVGVVSTGGGATVLNANGLQSSGTVESNFGNFLTQLQCTGNLKTDFIGTVTPGVALQLSANGLTTAGQPVVLINGGAGNIGLLGFNSSYSTQTTVGAAGAASALPATPSIYLPVVVGTTIYVLPLYAHA